MRRRTLTKLRKVFAEVVAEAQGNEGFAERLAKVLGDDEEKPSTRRRGRRRPGVLNPFQVLDDAGRDGLETALAELDTERLKDIVAEHGMDPARLAMKWKSADRLAGHIVAFVTARDRKGDAFRAKGGGGALDPSEAGNVRKERGQEPGNDRQ